MALIEKRRPAQYRVRIRRADMPKPISGTFDTKAEALKRARRKSSVCSKVEHRFLTLKHLWGFAKVRYRSVAKNANRAFAMLAMINLVK